jgi:hypothetical protein
MRPLRVGTNAAALEPTVGARRMPAGCTDDRSHSIMRRHPRKNTRAASHTHIGRFVEQLGRLAEGEGLPRTAGRMMAVLLICAVPMSTDELAARLNVSRASVSTNSRLLQSLGIANLITRPGSRRDYLQISGDPCSSLLTLGLHRMQSMCTAIREMRLAMSGGEFGVPRQRLQRMERFYELAIAQAQSALSTWRQLGVGRDAARGNRATARSSSSLRNPAVRKKPSGMRRPNVLD